MAKSKTKTKKTLVLLDAHAIIHRAYHALPEFKSSKGESTGALYGLSNMIMKIISDLKPDYIVACYDLPQKTFRHEVYDGYKAGRAKADDALVEQLKKSREIFEAFNIPIYDSPGFEADDILGTIVEKTKQDKDMHVVIASGDMDTMQLINKKQVEVYTLKKGINDTILYDEEKVLERFGFKPSLLPDYKGLRGDPSDNIIGVKGIGEKTATTLIKEFGTIENIYKKINSKGGEEAFKKIGITSRIFNLLKENEEEALFSKTLAEIRRDAPVKFELPKKTFWEKVDANKIKEMFTLFEFRSLLSRLNSFFTKNGQDELDELANEFNDEQAEKEEGQDELEQTSIALWLLNSDITKPGKEDILFYAKTKSFKEAKDYVFRQLKEKGLEQVYKEIEEPIIPIIKKMEEHGVLLDINYFKKLSEEYHKELDKLTKKIYEETGAEFNINSPKQLGEVLFGKMGFKTKKKTSTGSYSTNASVLEELAQESEVVKRILEYRELQKLLSTYIDVLPKMADKDGRLHAKFIQNGTTTGRFSSSDPNLQNLPIKSDLGKRIRNGFIAPKGCKLLALDYSQVELRVAAILSEDEKLTQIFKDGKDVHTSVASFVFGVPLDKVDSEMRRQAKVINFGIIYGMGVTALKKNLGGTREEAQKFYDNYFKQFQGVKDYLEEVKEFATKNGYTETLFGRRRFFPNINSRIPFLKSMAIRTAINAPIQGTATADIVKLAIRFAHEDLKEKGLIDKTKLILQIHDELVYEVDESSLEEVSTVIKKAMESVLGRSYLKFKTDIPLLVQFGSGDNLGEVK